MGYRRPHRWRWTLRLKQQLLGCLLVVFILCNYFFLNKTDSGALPSTTKRKAQQERKHLYEICPHKVIHLLPRMRDTGTEARLTTTLQGDLPVLLSVPHGGSTKDPMYSWQQKHLKMRGEKGEQDMESFQSRLSRVNSDTFTPELANLVVKSCSKAYKKTPYVVQARFHRRFVDVNRRLNVTDPHVSLRVADFKDDAANLLQGAAGTEVTVTYKRQGQTNTIKIIRESLEIKAVPHYSMVDDKTGYVVLRKFNEKASAETLGALRALKNQGATQLILDLRGNPGGLLHEAVNVTNIFVPKDQLVVTTKSKVKKYNKTYYTKRDAIDTEIPLVVLIDGSSASASEIVSGALQDMDRAVVVGTRSFGKGLVQRPKPLTYGTQMKITISRYYTPSGRCIQALDYWNRDENGKATRVKKENYNAFKTRNGRDVFDGGGVQPDIEVELSKQTPITKAILDENLVFNFATQYYYDNKVDKLNSFELSDYDFSAFKSYLKSTSFNFDTKTEEALNTVIAIAEEEELDGIIDSDIKGLTKALQAYKTSAINTNKEKLKSLLTDEIIKRYFYSEGLYDYYTANNIEINKALSILNNPTQYASILR